MRSRASQEPPICRLSGCVFLRVSSRFRVATLALGCGLLTAMAPATADLIGRVGTLDKDRKHTPGANSVVTRIAYPAPSVGWVWKKYDFGVRVGIVRGIDVTAEYQRNTTWFDTLHPDEALVTLRLAF
jgi:hypothetical protein